MVALGAFNGDGPVSKFLNGENLAVVGLLVGAVDLKDLATVVFREFASLVAELLAHLDVEVGGVDELDFTLSLFGLVVVQHPDIGSNPGVVEHVIRQRDDGINEVCLEYPSPDIGGS